MLPSPALLLISDRHQAQRDVSDIAEAAFAAGCRWLSLREKDLPAAEQIDLTRRLLRLAQGHGAKVTLHGEAGLAREAGANGVHLSAGSDPVAARRLLGGDALIGLSIHGAYEASAVDADAIDYVIAGPMFETQSKPGYGPMLGLEGLAPIVEACTVPVIAIGGIDQQNGTACIRAGAAGIAVMGGVMRADNPGDVVAKLIGALA